MGKCTITEPIENWPRNEDIFDLRDFFKREKIKITLFLEDLPSQEWTISPKVINYLDKENLIISFLNITQVKDEKDELNLDLTMESLSSGAGKYSMNMPGERN